MEARQHRSFAVEGGRRTCLGIVHFKGLVFVASDLDPHLSQRIPPQNLPHAVLRYVSNKSLRGGLQFFTRSWPLAPSNRFPFRLGLLFLIQI
jgi:hypothetical protein